jgi:hypothetical protein
MGNPPLYPLRWRGAAERGREGNDGDGAPGGRALPRLGIAGRPTTGGHDRAWWVQGVATATERLDT